MADDEQFSLCWNNFNTNLSAGFHDLLCRGDLVDVSLSAEGQIVGAHRLVLSVCSPYFRKMFTSVPSSTHAIVFLSNVTHSALKDLIQFMYCGEVNVKQDALPAFISTAESLQIKGLTDNDSTPPPPQEPTPPPPPTAPHVQQQQAPAQRIHRQQPRPSARYKIEAVDDVLGDDKGTTQIVIQTTAAPQATIVQQQQPQQQQLQTATSTTTATLVSTNKRSAQRGSQAGSNAVKRSKTTATASNVIDPLDSTTETTTTATTTQLAPQQITVQTTVVPSSEQKVHQQVRQQQATVAQEEAEYIDLPIEIPTKSEPDYTEEHAEVAGDGDTAYVEDDTYGDMRYDDSYFTENEDPGVQPAGANTSTSVAATTSKAVAKQQSQSYSDSSFVDTGGEQGNTEAQASVSAKVSTKVSTSATSTLHAQVIPPRKRGRPKTKVEDTVPKLKLLDKLKNATKNVAASKPAVYASTTKGGVKLVYEGHLFRFSFRKAEFSVFQCCFREHGEECKVRVVCDQKNVFPFDGEHVHFMQAIDKSVTSSQFIPGESSAPVQAKAEENADILIKKNETLVEVEDTEEEGELFEIHEIEESDAAESTAAAAEEENSNSSPTQAAGDTIDPNDFREKIKRRLQKALQNKKK